MSLSPPRRLARPHRGLVRALVCAGWVLAAGASARAQVSGGELPAQVPDWSLAAQLRLYGDGSAADAARLVERQRLLDEAERQMALGQVAPAQELLDQAALVRHAADTELAQVRCHMQAGDYRRALVFGAHAAGAHRREAPSGMALYAWLLQVGGQNRVAQRMLQSAREEAPADAALALADQRLASAWPQADGVLMQRPLRLAPYAVGAVVPAGAQVLGTAVLLPGGRHALAPQALMPVSAGPLWLRNGLGQTVVARPLGTVDALGLQLLALDTALPAPLVAPAARAPFAGSPGYLLEFASGTGDQAQPAWPFLRQGFFAGLPAAGLRPLGLDVPAGPRGGPVLDAAGRWVGIALRSADGRDQLVAVADLPLDRLGLPEPAMAAEPPAADGARPGVDEVYERGLRQALQLIGGR